MKNFSKIFYGIVLFIFALTASASSIPLPINQGGTGTNTQPSFGQVLVGNSSNKYDLVATSTLGLGTVTSVALSGGTTGLTVTGSPITTNGTIVLLGTLNVSNGGTGSTTLTGILKGNGTGSILSAVRNSDYQVPIVFTTLGTSGAATFDGTNLNIPQYAGTTYTATYPITLSGTAFGIAFGTTTANTWGPTQTFTLSPVFSTLGAGTVNSTSAGTLYNTATSSLSSGTGVSFTGTPGSLIGGTSLTINNSGVISVSCPGGFLSCSGTSPAAFTLGTLTVGNGGTGSTTLGGILIGNGSSAVQSVTVGTGLSLVGTTLSAVGSGSGTISTSSPLVSGQSVYATGVSTVASVATSTISSGTGISFSGTPGYLINGSALTVTNSGVISNSCPGGFLTCSGTNPSTFSLGTLTVPNGGTGSTTLTGLLKGNGVGAVQSAIAGTDYLVSALTSIGPVGQTTTGPAVTLATTTTSNNGLTTGLVITGSGTTLTFNASTSGILTPSGGGTGIATYASGDLIYASGAGTLTRIAVGTPGQVLGVVGTTPTWVATSTGSGGGGSPGGSGTELQYRAGPTTFGAVGASGYNSARGAVGIGTTTPAYPLQVSSSTAQQLVLSDGSQTSPQFGFRATNGSLLISTTSPSTYATDTMSTIFAITSAGRASIGLGAPTPAATLQLYEQNGTGASPSMIFGGNTGGDTDYWLARISNNDSADNDVFQIGKGVVPGTTSNLTLTQTGLLGIATTSPARELSITGSIMASSTTSTSTFLGKGINLVTQAGEVPCYAVNGTCLSTGGSTNAAGADTNVQFNDGGTAFGATTGFNFTKSNGRLTIPAGGWYGIGTASNNLFAYGSTTNDDIILGFGAGGQSATTTAGAASRNVAIGNTALQANTIGTTNTAVGYGALILNTSGSANVAVGQFAITGGANALTGSNNTAIGTSAMMNLRGVGNNNTGIGDSSFFGITTGVDNSCVGRLCFQTMNTSSRNTGIGSNIGATLSGSGNIIIGAYSNVLNLSGNAQLSIGNTLYGTGMYNTASLLTFGSPSQNGTIGIGTTTAQNKLTIHLNNGDTLPNSFLIASSTANSTTTQFLITRDGNVGIGTSSPWATLSLGVPTYNGVNPLFTIATSSNPTGQIFTVTGSTTTLPLTNAFKTSFLSDSGARIGIGTGPDTLPLLDQLTVDGRINEGTWQSFHCYPTAIPVTITNDKDNACQDFSWQEVSDGTVTVSASGGVPIAAMSFGTQGLDGQEFYLGTVSPQANFASTTPVMEVYGKINSPATATSSNFWIGFTRLSPSSASYTSFPGIGCYFNSNSAAANWLAVCSTGIATTTVDTGFASTSIALGAAASEFLKFRTEYSDSVVNFYMGSSGTSTRLVAKITTNIPTSLPVGGALSFGLGFSRVSLTDVAAFSLASLRVWMRSLGSLGF